MNLDDAFERLIDPSHEGGLSLDPRDKGNWTGGHVGVGTLRGTKYGISAASYPGEDIPNLTTDRAKQIYARDYWGPAGCDALPDLVKFDMFDLAVNTSAPGRPAAAIKVLQRACGADVDGMLGPKTLLAAQTLDPNRLYRRLTGQRIRYYTGLDPDLWAAYGRSWMNRTATNLMET